MGKMVLFLGAGASRASKCQLPRMAGFFEGLDPKHDLNALLNLLTGRRPASANLEEVLSHLDISRVRERKWGLSPVLGSGDPGVLPSGRILQPP